MTAGWDGIGHNWYRYPLLGSRLQNEFFYIPVTADGTVIDYRPPVLAFHGSTAEPGRGALREEGIEYVVVLPPTAVPELYWMEQRPALFEPVAREPRAPLWSIAWFRQVKDRLVRHPANGRRPPGSDRSER